MDFLMDSGGSDLDFGDLDNLDFDDCIDWSAGTELNLHSPLSLPGSPSENGTFLSGVSPTTMTTSYDSAVEPPQHTHAGPHGNAPDPCLLDVVNKTTVGRLSTETDKPDPAPVTHPPLISPPRDNENGGQSSRAPVSSASPSTAPSLTSAVEDRHFTAPYKPRQDLQLLLESFEAGNEAYDSNAMRTYTNDVLSHSMNASSTTSSSHTSSMSTSILSSMPSVGTSCTSPEEISPGSTVPPDMKFPISPELFLGFEDGDCSVGLNTMAGGISSLVAAPPSEQETTRPSLIGSNVFNSCPTISSNAEPGNDDLVGLGIHHFSSTNDITMATSRGLYNPSALNTRQQKVHGQHNYSRSDFHSDVAANNMISRIPVSRARHTQEVNDFQPAQMSSFYSQADPHDDYMYDVVADGSFSMYTPSMRVVPRATCDFSTTIAETKSKSPSGLSDQNIYSPQAMQPPPRPSQQFESSMRASHQPAMPQIITIDGKEIMLPAIEPPRTFAPTEMPVGPFIFPTKPDVVDLTYPEPPTRMHISTVKPLTRAAQASQVASASAGTSRSTRRASKTTRRRVPDSPATREKAYQVSKPTTTRRRSTPQSRTASGIFSGRSSTNGTVPLPHESPAIDNTARSSREYPKMLKLDKNSEAYRHVLQKAIEGNGNVEFGGLKLKAVLEGPGVIKFYVRE